MCAVYKKASTVFGPWLDKKLLKDGSKCTILNEVVSSPSKFLNPKTNEPQSQDVAKLKIEGLEGEHNMALNKPTLDALITAFGEDSINWQGHPLIIATEKTRAAGKIGTSVYLIPEGFTKIDNASGFAEIVKIKEA